MGDCQTVIPSSEAEQHVIAAAYHIMKALGENKHLNADTRKLLLDLDAHLSKMTSETGSNKNAFADVEKRFKQAERKVLNWEANQSMIWDSGPDEASQYLEAVYEIQTMIESSSGGLAVKANWKEKQFFQRAENAREIAMSRLEKELIYILLQHQEYFKPKHTSFHCHGEDVVYDESYVSVENELTEEASGCGSGHNKEPEGHIVDLVHAYVIPDLKSIANAMFACCYSQEFCEAFISKRREALDEYLALLKMQKFTIEDVLRMDWKNLNCEIKKWTWAMRIIIRLYIANEKRLCDQILGDFGSANPFCFKEIVRTSILSLLNFGEAVAMGSHQPEKFFRLLDMCEALTDFLLDIDSLLVDEAGSPLRIEFHKLSKKLVDSTMATFTNFTKAIAEDESSCPFPKGGVHHLTKYVMNYFMIFPEYKAILNLLLKDQDADDPNGVMEAEVLRGSPSSFCPMACHLRSITFILESNLHNKAQLYKDDALRHIFLMNNIHYIVQKVKGSELSLFFGDEWIRKHNGKFQQHAKNYERATWSSILSLLMDGGCSSSNSACKATLKDRCKGFNIGFEEVYRRQTSWSIPDPQLREDLRISTSIKVIHAYRSFTGKNVVSDKYIKYSTDDLESLLLDLFEGSSRSLRSSQRR